MSKDEAASPTTATDSVLLTGTIEAKQERDVMSLDVPNAFVQTEIPLKDKEGNDLMKVVMIIRGKLVDYMLEACPGTYDEYVVYDHGKKVLYVRMLRA